MSWNVLKHVGDFWENVERCFWICPGIFRNFVKCPEMFKCCALKLLPGNHWHLSLSTFFLKDLGPRRCPAISAQARSRAQTNRCWIIADRHIWVCTAASAGYEATQIQGLDCGKACHQRVRCYCWGSAGSGTGKSARATPRERDREELREACT